MTDVAIRIEGLTKRFDAVTALDGIDLEIPARTVFGLLGTNGAGKTTAILILSTILEPDAIGRSASGRCRRERTTAPRSRRRRRNSRLGQRSGMSPEGAAAADVWDSRQVRLRA